MIEIQGNESYPLMLTLAEYDILCIDKKITL